MLSNKKGGPSITVVIGLALGLAAFVLVTVLLSRGGKTFFLSTNQCTEIGGACVSNPCTVSNHGPGARILLEGKGACADDETCCTSNDIQTRQIEGRGLPGSSAITLEIPGKTKTYRNLDRVPLLLGQNYDFTLNLAEDLEDKHCTVQIVDSSRDVVVVGRNNNPLGPIEPSCNDVGNVFTSTTFSYDNLEQNLELQVIVYNDEDRNDRDTSAEFRLELENPARLLGLSSSWAKFDDVTLRCAQGVVCEEASYAFLGSGTLEEQRNECYRSPEDQTNSVAFLNGEADIRLETSSFVDTRACFYVKLQNSDEWIKILEGPLKLDNVPPEIDLDGREIQCDDLGSGVCDRYYYHLLGKLTQNDVDSVDEALFSAYRQGIEAREGCPNVTTSLSSYRSTTNAQINTGNALFATYCISAVDDAGNRVSPAIIKEYTDPVAAANVGFNIGGSVLGFLDNLV